MQHLRVLTAIYGISAFGLLINDGFVGLIAAVFYFLWLILRMYCECRYVVEGY